MNARRNPQFHKVPLGLILGLLGASCLSACAGRSTVKSNWTDNAPRNQVFTRLLVVGVSPDYSQRCNFEFWLVRDLRSDRLNADASCSSMPKDEPLSRESIERLVATLHSDGVLATSLVSGDWQSKEGGSYDTRSTGEYKYVGSGYGVYGVPVDYYQFKSLPSIANARGQAHVLTKLFETHGAALIYTIDTKAKDIESSQLGLATITPAIADRLRHDGLVH